MGETKIQQPRSHHLFTVGSEVEVTIDDEGFHGAWFRATLLKPSTAHSPSKKKVWIQYKTLLVENSSKPLKENVPISNLRPVPPDISYKIFEEGDIVDADYQDGWWIGTVRQVLENSTYKVFFSNPVQEIDFERNKLRFHQDWVDGMWVLPQKMKTSKDTSRCSEQDKQETRSVTSEDAPLHKSLCLWNQGSGDYDVLKVTPKEVGKGMGYEMNSHLASSVGSPMAGSLGANSLEFPIKFANQLKSGDVEKSSDYQATEKGSESEQHQASINSHKRKRGRPRKLMVLPKGGVMEQNGTGSNSEKVVTRGCSSDFQIVYRRNVNEPSECKTKEIKNIMLSTNVDDDQPLLMWLGGTQSPAGVNKQRRTRRNFKQNTSDSEPQSVVKEVVVADESETNGLAWPFAKKSPVWKAIDSLEVFRTIPQTPHFHPLNEHKEECREGLAIGNMVTFSSLVDKVSKLQFDDPRDVFEGILDSLFDLEKHGFEVSMLCNRVNELLSIKDSEVQYQNESKEVEKKILEHNQWKTTFAGTIETIGQKIAELQKQHDTMKLEIEAKDDEITRLQSRVEAIKNSAQNTKLAFQMQAALPFK